MAELRTRNDHGKSASSHLRISLFGRFEARRDRACLQGLNPGKVQELFAYLVLFRNRVHSRDSLATLLWGDYTTEKAKKHLRQALWQLRTILGPDACALRVEPEWIGCGRVGWLDVEMFEQTFAAAEEHIVSELDGDVVCRLEEAIALYGSGLLTGFYQDWCLDERERLQGMYLRMLTRLMDYSEARGDYRASIEYGERILQQDAAHERAHQRLMCLLYASGSRSAALRQFHRCVAALNEELGVAASHDTMALYEMIRRDDPAPRLRALPVFRGHKGTLREVLAKVGQMQTALLQLQSDIEAALVAENAQSLKLNQHALNGQLSDQRSASA